MKKHVKIYLEEMDFDPSDFIPCEVCQDRAVDIHHIEMKGMGGSKTKDYLENLAALCRLCHRLCHDSIEFNQKVKRLHKKYIKFRKQGRDLI